MIVCLIVCFYPINVKMSELTRPKFFFGPHMTPGKVFMNDQNLKISLPTKFYFH